MIFRAASRENSIEIFPDNIVINQEKEFHKININNLLGVKIRSFREIIFDYHLSCHNNYQSHKKDSNAVIFDYKDYNQFETAIKIILLLQNRSENFDKIKTKIEDLKLNLWLEREIIHNLLFKNDINKDNYYKIN